MSTYDKPFETQEEEIEAGDYVNMIFNQRI
jgi:hypothetical protein